MRRLIPLCLALIALAGVAGLPRPGAARGKRPPNIVFIMADDLGYGHLGCYGQTKIRTPHIDRLAREGMRFTDAYAGCSVCAPCRSVLLTGKHMGHTSVRRNSGGVPLLDEDVTIPEVLKQAGYATGVFGKWGVGDAGTPGVATKQGVDEFFGYYNQVHAHSYYPPYLWHNDEKYPLPGNSGRPDGLTGEKRGQYAQDEIHAKALDFIRRNRDRPFFCYLPYTIPHTELLVPQDSLDEYAGKFPEPFPWVDPRRHYADQPQPRAAFAAMVTRMDRGVGEIMALLAELGLDENTIVFFTSDNGGQGSGGPDANFFRANGPLRGYKGQMYEGGIRVPMIARWPGRIAKGAVSDHPWYLADAMATLAELAGVRDRVPRDTDGLSVVPTLLGERSGRPQQTHRYMYWELQRGRNLTQAIRMGRWKGVRHINDTPLEVYDLETDLGERNNLAESRPRLAARLERLMTQARVPMRPQKEPPHPPGRGFN